MPTTWYFRSTNAPTGPTGTASTDTDSFPSTPSDKNTPKDMTAAKGSSQTSQAGAYSCSSSPLYTLARIFVGPALAAQTLTGGQSGYKVGVAIKESNVNMNLYHRVFVYMWRSGSGNVKTIISPNSCGTEHGNAETGCVITAAGAAGDFSIQAGDRLVVEEWWDIRNTKGTVYTATDYYDGATDVVEATGTSDAAAYFYCPQTLAVVYTQTATATEVAVSAIRRKTSRLLSVIEVASNTLARIATFKRSLALTESASLTLRRKAVKLLTVAESAVATVTRALLLNRLLSVIEAGSATLARSLSLNRVLFLIEASATSLLRQVTFKRILSIIEVASPTVKRLISQALSLTESAALILAAEMIPGGPPPGRSVVVTQVGEEWIADVLDGASLGTQYIGWGTGPGTPAKSDTTLFTEASEARQSATRSQPAPSVIRYVATMTADDAKTITNAGVLTALTAGTLIIHVGFNGISVQENDQIHFVIDIEVA